jgi:hypothetical protein
MSQNTEYVLETLKRKAGRGDVKGFNNTLNVMRSHLLQNVVGGRSPSDTDVNEYRVKAWEPGYTPWLDPKNPAFIKSLPKGRR